ncbi:MAG: murein biosynthesis integral membrane protein MurJ [Desulfobacteraceae bacterium]|nr:murein biosynthesis integral membrane protein MurJ [Desulfobacteraceae bacterium]
MRTPIQRKIGLAAVIMMSSVFLSRVLGLLRESTIAAIGGLSLEMDAYKTAFVLPEILNHALASGFLSITFIPIFLRYTANDDETGAWRIFSILLNVFGLVLSALISLCLIAAPAMMPVLTPGRSEPEFFEMAVRMTRIVLPAQFFFFAGSLFMAVQFARKRFFIPALSPIIYNTAIILGGLLLGPRLGMEGFSWGALIGAFLGAFVLQWYGACKAGMRFCLCFDLRHPDLLRYILLTLPLMLGLTMTFSAEIFSKFFSSYLPPGSIACVDFAWRIVMMLSGFFGQAAGVASYPFLAQLAAEKKFVQMNTLYNTTLKYLAFVIPVSILMIILRHEIIFVLFERFDFTSANTSLTAKALCAMLTGAFAITAQTVVSRGFYATQDTLTPAVYGTLTTALSLPIYWFGMQLFGVFGVALGISISAIAQVLVLFYIWNRKSKNKGSIAVCRFYLKMTLLCLPTGALLWAGRRLCLNLLSPSGFAGHFIIIVLMSCLFLCLMVLCTHLFKISEAQFFMQKIRSKLRRF